MTMNNYENLTEDEKEIESLKLRIFELSCQIDELSDKIKQKRKTIEKFETELTKLQYKQNKNWPVGLPVTDFHQLIDGEKYSINSGAIYKPVHFIWTEEDGKSDDDVYRYVENLCAFTSDESANKNKELIFEFNKALISAYMGKAFSVTVLTPLLRKGLWVAQSKVPGSWYLFKNKPYISSTAEGMWEESKESYGFYIPFNLSPADDWTNSLIECGL